MVKSLVVYFSRGDEEYAVGEVSVGNTEILAKAIVERLGADEFKINPVTPYPKSYQECVDLATKELEDDARPAYVGDIDIKDYDTIFLGYPIWWGDLPMIVYTFLENHDFNGKTVIPFNTAEGSGNSGTYGILKSKLAGAELKGDGFNMTGSKARTEAGKEALNTWLDSLGF